MANAPLDTPHPSAFRPDILTCAISRLCALAMISATQKRRRPWPRPKRRSNTPSPATLSTPPEAVGVFDSAEALQAAIYDLRMNGFNRFDLSLLGGKEAMEGKLGGAYCQAKELEDNPDAPRAAFVSEEAIGELEGAVVGGFFHLGSAIAMAAIAVGGAPAAVLGTLFARRIGNHHREYYERQIRNGGLLLWVRSNTKEKQDLAVKILRGHSGNDVHVHDWSEARPVRPAFVQNTGTDCT